jgi:fluoroquinolone transport system permease protein
MRLLHAVWADVRFQLKHGFYLIYVILTIMYLIILSFLTEDILSVALPLVVFSDPSVLGLFFIGGIILLEKGQGVLMVLVVSPLRTMEYIMSKVISLALISVLAAFAIAFFSHYPSTNWLLLLLATILTSALFTLIGIMINAGCETVNQYMLRTIPYMLLFMFAVFFPDRVSIFRFVYHCSQRGGITADDGGFPWYWLVGSIGTGCVSVRDELFVPAIGHSHI